MNILWRYFSDDRNPFGWHTGDDYHHVTNGNGSNDEIKSILIVRHDRAKSEVSSHLFRPVWLGSWLRLFSFHHYGHVFTLHLLHQSCIHLSLICLSVLLSKRVLLLSNVPQLVRWLMVAKESESAFGTEITLDYYIDDVKRGENGKYRNI